MRIPEPRPLLGPAADHLVAHPLVHTLARRGRTRARPNAPVAGQPVRLVSDQSYGGDEAAGEGLAGAEVVTRGDKLGDKQGGRGRHATTIAKNRPAANPFQAGVCGGLLLNGRYWT